MSRLTGASRLFIAIAPLALSPLVLRGEGAAPARPRETAEARPAASLAGFRDALAPFLRKNCLECHGGEKPKAGISFEKIGDQGEALKEARKWEKALAALRARKMPPR